MCVREGRVTTISNFKKRSSGRSVCSISYASCWREIVSTTRFSMVFNGFSKKADLFGLILNSASSFALIDK